MGCLQGDDAKRMPVNFVSCLSYWLSKQITSHRDRGGCKAALSAAGDFIAPLMLRKGASVLRVMTSAVRQKLPHRQRYKWRGRARSSCGSPRVDHRIVELDEVLAVTDEVLEPIRKLLESIESDVIPYRARDSFGSAQMWKPEHRRSADRNGLRYPSD